MKPSDTDPFSLRRFVQAQDSAFSTALAEIRAGRKLTHWMWFVFPQLAGLGFSPMAVRYAISGLDEARAYLHHPVLGERLRQCCRELLALEGRTAHDILNSPDDLKLQSCATLFDLVESDSVFAQVLAKYYRGQRDGATLAICESPPTK